MSEVIARLVVQRGPEPGKSFLLTEDAIRIGRTADSDIVIGDPEMSRQHAQLVRQPDGYAIQDLGSTNGTFVNYQRLTGLTMLSHGDVIAFGDAIALAVPPSAPAPRPPAARPPQPSPFAEPIVESSPEVPPLTAEAYAAQSAARRRRIIIGCGVGFLLLICLCMGALFFLDGYQQGRLLYCGGLRPFWELILGPFGFNPACT